MTAELLDELSEHLAALDPPDLPARSHRLTQEGDPDRFEMLAWLPMSYAAHVRLERDEREARVS